MLKRFNTKFSVAKAGDSFRVRVPELDRAKVHSLNLIGVIRFVTENNI